MCDIVTLASQVSLSASKSQVNDLSKYYIVIQKRSVYKWDVSKITGTHLLQYKRLGRIFFTFW